MEEQKLPYGQSILGFESLEEITEYMVQQEREALANTMPEQWEITWGSYCFRLVDDLPIWGYIQTEQEFINDNLKPDQTELDEEMALELEGLRDAHTRGHRYGKWYSGIEPDGEYGSAHVVSLWPITEEDFNVAQENGWKLWKELAYRIDEQVTTATTRMKRDERDDSGDREE